MPIDIPTLITLLPGKIFMQILDKQKEIKIAKDRTIKFCPNSFCSAMLRLKQRKILQQRENNTKGPTNPGPGNIICPNCNINFCVECDKPAHWPASCEDAEWFEREFKLILNETPPETGFYIAKVKRCPKCKMIME